MTTAVWTPACMSEAELAAWERSQLGMTSQRADRPCADCLLGFAVEMRAIGRCNGQPGGAEEDPEMELTTTAARRQSLDLVAPCATCAHEPVCALMAAMESIATIGTDAGRPHLPRRLVRRCGRTRRVAWALADVHRHVLRLAELRRRRLQVLAHPQGRAAPVQLRGWYLRMSIGVAHKTLPCGTRVEFSYRGRTLVVPVVDRGPFSAGMDWDFTSEACLRLRHCFTGPISWRIVKP